MQVTACVDGDHTSSAATAKAQLEAELQTCRQGLDEKFAVPEAHAGIQWTALEAELGAHIETSSSTGVCSVGGADPTLTLAYSQPHAFRKVHS